MQNCRALTVVWNNLLAVNSHEFIFLINWDGEIVQTLVGHGSMTLILIIFYLFNFYLFLIFYLITRMCKQVGVSR